MKEIWKNVVGYEGLYQVSSEGRIKSMRTTKVMKARVNKYGYKQLTLYKENQQGRTTKTLHRLVAIAFIPNIKNLATVNHKDLDKLNNNISNLEWATFAENTEHAKRLGAMQDLQWGSKNSSSKLTEEDVFRMREMWKSGKYLKKEIAKQFNVSPSNVTQILKGKRWCHI